MDRGSTEWSQASARFRLPESHDFHETLGGAGTLKFMANGLVIHISAGEDKHTEILTAEHILIGKSDQCDLRLRASDLPAVSGAGDVVLEVGRSSGLYLVTDFDPLLGITHNGKPIAQHSEIKDGMKFASLSPTCHCSFSPFVLYLLSFPLSSTKRMLLRSSNRPRSNRQLPLAATTPKYSCVSSLASWCARSTPPLS